MPTSVTATAKGETTVSVTWGKVDEAAGYEIQWALNETDFESEVTILGSGHSTTTSFEIEDLNPNTPYYVRVRTTGDGDYMNSLWSAPAPFTIVKEDDVPLDPPTGVKLDGHTVYDCSLQVCTRIASFVFLSLIETPEAGRMYTF